MDVLDDTTKKMMNALDHLKGELKSLPSGRANPAMIEKVLVPVYGTNMRITDLASISIPEPRQLLISPFDENNAGAIAKGLEAANLNLRVVRDGKTVRVMVPEMNEETRQKIKQTAKKKCEDSKISIRNVRREANEKNKKQKDAGEIPEDLMKKNEKKIQELTDKYCKMADDLVAEKEKEIMKV